MIFVGTSGYSYEDWRGCFYPKDLPKSKFLDFYLEQFCASEINFTYYRIPDESIFSKIASKSINHPNAKFCIKATSIFTHERKWTEKECNTFLKGISPLEDKIGCLLFQFPHSFHLSEESINYLEKLKTIFSTHRLAFEFRAQEWTNEEVLDFMKRNNIGFVCVDEPRIKGLMKDTVLSTSDLGYIRFHGRNAEKWYNNRKPEERYDYLYSEEELSEWIPKIKILSENSKTVFIFFNNHPKGKAVENAKKTIEMLRQSGLEVH